MARPTFRFLYLPHRRQLSHERSPARLHSACQLLFVTAIDEIDGPQILSRQFVASAQKCEQNWHVRESIHMATIRRFNSIFCRARLA